MVITYVLSDEQWSRIEPLIAGKKGDRGRTGKNNRLFVDGVFWIMRTGAPWRSLPEKFGKWNTVFKRFERWARKGVWERILKTLSKDADTEWLMMDSTIVRAHQNAAGAKGGSRLRL